jgi:hypothetical protein
LTRERLVDEQGSDAEMTASIERTIEQKEAATTSANRHS